MSTGPDDPRRAPEPTFADVMNSFSFDSGRPPKRRKWGRRRDEEQEPEPEDTEPGSALPDAGPEPPAAERAGPNVGRSAPWPPPSGDVRPIPEAAGGSSAAVRPYAWTRGRTRSGMDLRVETLVSTSPLGRDQLAILPFEHRSVAELCERVCSVAEVAALLSVPLGVAKVLIGDMAGQGLIAIHQASTGTGDTPDLALMERVLSGLRRL